MLRDDASKATISGRNVTTAVPMSVDVSSSTRFGGPADYGTYAIVKRIGKIDEQVSLRGMQLLDIGCGNGSYTVELSRRAKWVCALDILEANLRAFREPICRVQGIGESLPFAAETFDAVTMIEVLEHTVSDIDVVHECFRVLRPSGLLILFVPNKLYPFESHPCHCGSLSLGPHVPFVSWLPSGIRKHLCYARIYTRRQLLSMARSAGFELRHSSYMFPPLDWFPLPKWMKEMYRRCSTRLEHTPMAVLGVSLVAILQKPIDTMGKKRVLVSQSPPPMGTISSSH